MCMLYEVFGLLALINSAFCNNYVLLPQHEDVYAPCPEFPKHTLHEMADISNVSFVFSDDSIHCEGSATIIWDVEPSDRIVMKSNVYRFQRGQWVPTLFNMFQKDFCKKMWDKNEIWYTSTQHIIEPDKKCFNHRHATYTIEPHNIGMKFTIPGLDISGRYKLNIIMEAVNENGEVKDFVCFEVQGDMRKT